MLRRQPQEENTEGAAGGSTRMPNINYLVNMTGALSPDEFASLLEPLFRKVVREEVERAIPCFRDPLLRAPSNPVGTSEESSLQLQFVTKLPGAIFTNSPIEAEDGSPLRIELVDGRTNKRITSGPLSSIKMEIVVLNGDFGSDEGEDWTEKEFNGNIIRERVGKRPLITGEVTAMLQEGIGCLHNVIITDNSSWIRCRKFRLGARAVQKVSAVISIREARSVSFIVKERRGLLNRKHHPPSLSDKVWHLEKIAKDGTLQKRMTSRGINTVQDLLQLYEADASSLRKILGKQIANRTWETIIKHARTCVVDDNKMYAYYQSSNQASILFNSVMKVAQATLDGQTYQSLDKLTHSQKILVLNLRRQAYYNKNQWVLLDALPSTIPSSALTNLPRESLVGLSPLLHHLDYSVLDQENRQLDCPEPENHIIAKVNNQSVAKSSARQDLSSDCSAGESSHHLGYSQGPFAPNDASPEELFNLPSSISGNLMMTPEHTFLIGLSSSADVKICPSGTGLGVAQSGTVQDPCRGEVGISSMHRGCEENSNVQLGTSLNFTHGKSLSPREFWVL